MLSVEVWCWCWMMQHAQWCMAWQQRMLNIALQCQPKHMFFFFNTMQVFIAIATSLIESEFFGKLSEENFRYTIETIKEKTKVWLNIALIGRKENQVILSELSMNLSTLRALCLSLNLCEDEDDNSDEDEMWYLIW